MTTPNSNDLLDRVRKLLAKAEDEGCTPQEAEALTAKASELMARYGIERAQLGALHPETDKPADQKFTFEAPWVDVKSHLLAAVATAVRCQCVLTQTASGDLDRAELLYTSLLVQMARALARESVPAYGNSAKAWRRSWMLGYAAAAVARIRAAEEKVTEQAKAEDTPGTSTALVLVDRSVAVKTQVSAAYPRLKKKRTTYTGSGYGDGYRQGEKADIGGAKVQQRARTALR
jgi:hypothetical protein